MKFIKCFFVLAVCFISCNNSQNKTEIPVTVETKTGELIQINPKEIPSNPIKLIGEEWMLITAGNAESYNTMTASWGAIGELWSRPVTTCYIRPERHTYGFMENSQYYTFCFFEEEYRQALNYCGTHSGRDHQDRNKAEVAGLTPAYTENGSVYFREAYLVVECKKLYADQFSAEHFTAEVTMGSDAEGPSLYNQTPDMHKFYIGEIVNCWMKK